MPSDGDYLVPMARNMIRRLDQFTVTVAGDNYRDVKVYDGEIIASITAHNNLNAVTTQAAYRSGGNYDGQTVLLQLGEQPIGESRGMAYPLGRIRMRSGDVRFTYRGCVVGDGLNSYVVVEQRWPF